MDSKHNVMKGLHCNKDIHPNNNTVYQENIKSEIRLRENAIGRHTNAGFSLMHKSCDIDTIALQMTPYFLFCASMWSQFHETNSD